MTVPSVRIAQLLRRATLRDVKTPAGETALPKAPKPQQRIPPPDCNPQVWLSPAPTDTNVPAGGAA